MMPKTPLQRARSVSPKLSEQQLTSRVKELEESTKAMERSQKMADRRRSQDMKEAKKKVTRELQCAQRTLTRSEHEASKLAGQLTRAEQEVLQAVARQAREAERREQGISRTRQKQGKIGSGLRDKMATVGQARGRLSHAQMAKAMLEKGVEIGTGCPLTVEVSDQGTKQAAKNLSSQTEQDLHDGDTQLRDDLIVKLHEEVDHLRWENRELREKLSAADRRCSAAVQLLVEVQAAPLQKSDSEFETLQLEGTEAILKAQEEEDGELKIGSGVDSLTESQAYWAKGKNSHTLEGISSASYWGSSGSGESAIVELEASKGQTQPDLVLTAEQTNTGGLDHGRAAFTQPALPVASMTRISSLTPSPRQFPTLLAGVASATPSRDRPQTPQAVLGRMVSCPIASNLWSKYNYQQQGKQQAFIRPVAAGCTAQVKVAGGVAFEPIAAKPPSALLRAEPVAAAAL